MFHNDRDRVPLKPYRRLIDEVDYSIDLEVNAVDSVKRQRSDADVMCTLYLICESLCCDNVIVGHCGIHF